jgi:hypothetical protein
MLGYDIIKYNGKLYFQYCSPILVVQLLKQLEPWQFWQQTISLQLLKRNVCFNLSDENNTANKLFINA